MEAFGYSAAVGSVTTPSKQPPKRPKSPPKTCEEWIASRNGEISGGIGKARGAKIAAASWPERAPEGEELFDGPVSEDGAGLILGTLESIKEDIQRHAREPFV